MYRSESRTPITPQLALRVAMLGAAALVLFGLIFFRLWYLQVLSGDVYLAEANDNRIREIKVHAPRGKILDRNGEVLVDNRTGLAVQVEPSKLPRGQAEREDVYRRLGGLLEMRPQRVYREIRKQTEELSYTAVTLRQNVGYERVYYLQENADEFPGVKVERVFLRRYPKGTRAAHLLGYVGEISGEQLTEKENADREQGDIIGQSGIEVVYDRFLRGRNGASRVQVDANGQPKGELSERQAVPGQNLRLTLDNAVQKAGEGALARRGLPGGFIALNPKNGEVLGLASHPTFEPKTFTRPLSQGQVDELFRQGEDSPISNRATQGLYPAGSSWKPITAVAALEGGLIEPDSVINDPGSLEVGGISVGNAGGGAYGAISLRRALQVSSNVFFAKLGQQADSAGDGMLIQKWAHALGVGRPSGLDLPNEESGRVPSPAWRNNLFEKGETDRPWTVGDSINLGIGQGDLLTNPLYMAIAYATIANRGQVPTPRLGLRVEETGGRPLQEIRSEDRRRVPLDGENAGAIMEGLRMAAMDAGGTGAGVFGEFPVEVAGKTGTAEVLGKGDQSWFVAVAPYDDPEIVVALTIERAGFGSEAAAPAAREILEAYFNVKPRDVGESADQTPVTGPAPLD